MALKGIRVIELVGLAPAPFCGLVLSDFGAKVLRIDNPKNQKLSLFNSGKETMYLDLKTPQGSNIFKKLMKQQSSDVLIDPFRPGVLERLDLGPKHLCADNASLIYARLSGYGQTGPLALKAGHDINYLSLSGVLSLMGHSQRPPIGPLNLLGDFGGGGLMCALGILVALFERERSGKGQIVDSSITEGTAYISTFLWETLKYKSVFWPHLNQRASNLLDFGAPFYRCYKTKDGKFLAVGALEAKFYYTFITTIGLDVDAYDQFDTGKWNQFSEDIEQIIVQKTLQDWIEIFDPLDCCVTPVVDIEQVHKLPQHRERSAFGSDKMPRPAPSLSRTPPTRKTEITKTCTSDILEELNYSEAEIKQLRDEEIID